MASDVHARHVYSSDDVEFGSRFVDILDLGGPGEPELLVLERLDETEPVEVKDQQHNVTLESAHLLGAPATCRQVVERLRFGRSETTTE